MSAVPSLFRLLPLLALFAAARVAAGQPDHELTPEAAAKLIQLERDNHSENVRIAMVLEGSGKAGPFEVAHVRRVVAVHPVAEDGRRVRRMRIYDFCWNETYGWFHWEKREERGGDAVWIWSELEGEVVVR